MNITQHIKDIANSLSLNQDFRLTLTTATPVTSVDVTAATTLYFSPYKGNKISLYNGTTWDTIASAEISIAVPATTSQMYDVFVYNNAGVATLELTAWTNDTTRATALVRQDGVLCKTGALTRRYVGSFRTTAVSGQTEDSLVKRYVWNYDNRVKKKMFRQETTASWTYTTFTYRQANGNAANQLDFIIGVAEDNVSANLIATSNNSTAGTRSFIAIGLDSAVTPDSILTTNSNAFTSVNSSFNVIYSGFIGTGRHYLTWLENSIAAGLTTWAGTISSGIQGELLG